MPDRCSSCGKPLGGSRVVDFDGGREYCDPGCRAARVTDAIFRLRPDPEPQAYVKLMTEKQRKARGMRPKKKKGDK